LFIEKTHITILQTSLIIHLKSDAHPDVRRKLEEAGQDMPLGRIILSRDSSRAVSAPPGGEAPEAKYGV
jgi:hypothetical protein